MSADFQGLSVVSFESRRAAEMAALITRHGGKAIPAPSMREIPNPTHEEAIAFADALLAGEIDIVIHLTGVGTRMLVEAVGGKHAKEDFIAALRKVPLVCRGPKPVAALRELGLKPTLEVEEPNTWQDLLAALDRRLPVEGRRVAVQEYGVSNAKLIEGLESRGASVMRVPVYQWALPEDVQPLRAAIAGVIEGAIDVAMFTSTTQVTHLFQLAAEDGRDAALREGFKRVLIASIGPIATEGIIEHGLHPDYEPDSPHMMNLVRDTARRSHDLLEKKRAAASQGIDTNHWRRIDMRWGTSSEFRVISSGFRVPSSELKDKGTVSHPSEVLTRNSELGTRNLFLRACRREPVPYTPVWLMRQAGRYQRAYRDIRKGTTMLGLCKSPELAAEVTLMAVDRLGVDAAIIFSDILTVVEPLGFSLDFVKNEGPVIGNPFRGRTDIPRLGAGDPMELSYVYDAIRITRRALRPDIALIGFCGAPFTVASYIIEGGKSKDYAKTKTMMFRDPLSWNTLMTRLVDLQIDYLNLQIEAGADAVQIFDSWAGSLSPDHYREHVMPHVKRLIEGISSEFRVPSSELKDKRTVSHPSQALTRNSKLGTRNSELTTRNSELETRNSSVPVINFATGNPALLPLMAEAGGDVIGLDWRIDLRDAWKTIGYDKAIMGNIDPIVLFCSPAEIRKQTQLILDKAEGRPGHIFNLGHGITPDMPPENVAELVDAVHELSRR